ncbi:hypothetical protein [Xanthobacter sediminis]
MPKDWLSIIKERGEVVKGIARDVPPMLAAPDLTLDQATRLYQVLEGHAQAIEQLVADLEEDEAPDEFIEAADSLDDMMSDIAAAAAERMAALRRR